MFSYLGGLHFGCPSRTSGGGRHSLPKMQHPDHPLINLITESKEEVYIDDGEDTVDEFMLSLNIGDYSVDELSLFSFHSQHTVKKHCLCIRVLQIMAGGRRKRMRKSMAETVQVSSRSDDPNTASDLPTELLELIFSQLNLRDNIRASAVCKNWLAVTTSIREPNKAPWLMSFPKSGDWYQFYDPSSRRMYYAKYPELRDSRICYAKDGWLLAFKPRTRRVFFFHPFTRELMKLPKNESALDNVAFSAAPTSSSCVLFTIKNINPTVVAISTCRPGASGWTTVSFQTYLPFVTSIWNKVEFCKGLFYCLSLHGLLGLFNPETSMWIISSVHPPICTQYSCVEQWRRGKFMVEHNGDLFLIYTCAGETPFIYKFDDIEGFWQETSCLGGVTLFVNSLSSVGGSDFHGYLRNKICFSKFLFHGKRCVTYSPQSDRYYPRKRYYDWGQEDAFQTIWIHPPQPQHIASLLQG